MGKRLFLCTFISLFPFLFSQALYAQGLNFDPDLLKKENIGRKIKAIKKQIRPFVKKYLGEDLALKYLGPPPTLIFLPKIPKVTKKNKIIPANTRSKMTEIKLPEKDKMRYDYLFLQELFSVVRKEKVNSDEINKWMNVLGQGSSREGIYRAIVLDHIYASYENYGGIPSAPLLDFSMKFSELYINQKIQTSSLQTINFYSIKRIIIEKFLEVLDAFPKDNDDLFDWYAVLSSDMADNYSGVWDSALRKNPSKKRHKKWAKAVPLQVLKGELIIKLHKLFNSYYYG